MLSRSNRLGVWFYRRTSGAAGGGAAKALVLTVPGVADWRPGVARYARKSGRVIPVAMLTPA